MAPGGVERLNRAEIAGPIDDDRVAGIDEAAREQIEPLLRARQHQDALGRDAEPLGDRLAQRRLPFGRAVPPDRQALALDHVVDRLLKGLDRKAVDRRLAGGERQHLGVRRVADRVAQRRVARAKRGGGDLAAPRERRAGRIGRRADERAAADVAAQQPARLELAIRADDGGAADAEPLRELALRRHARSRRQIAARDRRFEKADEVSVEGPRGPDELPFDLLNHEASD